ncbi:3-isopropylmalate dehydrogenase [Heliophilum fasciatum]|uniref:3-isopropylmalate dehydrogenase n=1 Tax=Heliophilum fasciatum TaxID=35700 RepID=A0A4R2RPG4_9FIRM|nr:3-isopropylmalate dehydrogenase [Heliophilum fasciatum]MCW2277646.1 3-isopropylmalate dehydrogenase [Heliophilum fasciatum]TCP64994.1 3-isopropylmalate dehydrogenase [Heliophilum fasciatum]
MNYRIAVLPGDGIGAEVVPQALRVLDAVAAKAGITFEYTYALIGGAAIDATGHPLPPETLELCRNSDAVLLGAIGGPKWDTLPSHLRPEVAALLPLRKELGLYANIRPCHLFPALADASTLKREVLEGVDMVVIRELTGGLYFGEKKRETLEDGSERAVDTLVYSTPEVERIVRLACETAKNRRGQVCSVDKANVLESSRLWRETALKVAEAYPEITMSHMYVDNAAMQLVRNPRQFDVLVTENMFGDILTDQASMLSGSLGMLASASIGGEVALYEPAHGSAPDIAGQNKANPLATILSVAMMLEYSFKRVEEARAIEAAVDRVLNQGYRTGDIMEAGKTLVNTVEMTDCVINALA